MDKKAQIIQAAFSILSQKGILDTSVDDIARKAGISKKTLYVQFRSKDQLIKEAFSWKMLKLSKSVDEVVSKDICPIEKIALYIEVICQSISEISLKAFYDLVKLKTLATAAAEEYLKHAVFIRFNKLLDQAKATGIIKPDLNSGKVLMNYWNILSPYLLMKTGKEDLNDSTHTKSLSDVLKYQLIDFYKELLLESHYSKLVNRLNKATSIH